MRSRRLILRNLEWQWHPRQRMVISYSGKLTTRHRKSLNFLDFIPSKLGGFSSQLCYSFREGSYTIGPTSPKSVPEVQPHETISRLRKTCKTLWEAAMERIRKIGSIWMHMAACCLQILKRILATPKKNYPYQ